MKNEMMEKLLIAINNLTTRQAAVERQLGIIAELAFTKIDKRTGHSELVTMEILGIADRRTFLKHVKKINHKGTRFFPEDIDKLRASMANAKKRPHLRKIKISS